MEHFAQLKRRTTDLFQSLPQSLPQMPQIPQMPSLTSPTKTHAVALPYNTMKGTWERVAIPPLPRSSHSMDVVAGTAYVFGGEGTNSREPVDNSMHAIILPTGSASADYYLIKPVAAKPTPLTAAPIPTVSEPPPESDSVAISEPTEVTEEGGVETAPKDKGKGKAIEVAGAVDEIPLPGPALGDVPAPRLGHATAVIGNRIFLFGGRGGPEMTPLEERGRVWVFDTKTHTWTYLDPAASPVPTAVSASESGRLARSAVAYPPARSYHSAVATDLPASPDDTAHHLPRRAASWKQWVEGDMAEVGTPQRPIVGNVAARARDADSDGFGTFFVLGGCLTGGARTNDLWAFDVRTRVWQQLPSAPGLPRGGAALCISRNRLYRFGGFNGATEEGGRLDYLQLAVGALQETSVQDIPPTVAAVGAWQSLVPEAAPAPAPEKGLQRQPTVALATGASGEETEEDDGPDNDEGPGEKAAVTAPLVPPSQADGSWPAPRSVASLEAVTMGGGWEYLVLSLGERSPSTAGHEAAGTFWGDVWAFKVPSDELSAASVSDAVTGAMRHVMHRGWLGSRAASGVVADGRWARLVLAPYDPDEAMAEGFRPGQGMEYGPGPRGWFASAPMRELEENAILIFGGLNDGNQRLGDAWILRLGAEERE